MESDAAIAPTVLKFDREDRFVLARSDRVWTGDPKDEPIKGLFIGSLASNNLYKKVNRLELNCSLENIALMIRGTPLYQAIQSPLVRVIFVPTLRYCLVFWRVRYFVVSDWGKYDSLKKSGEWEMRRCEYDGADEASKTISSSIVGEIREHIESAISEGELSDVDEKGRQIS